MKTSSLATERMMILSAMMLGMKDELIEAEVNWEVIHTNNQQSLIPTFKLKFKNGKELKGHVER